ncbi:hypothetical protein [Haloferula sp. BvORR071]|uniref:hypothetical protein n=1 Tax=Haloferula sp. BvORR071 TaxID=1396141 RepID=UPI002240E8B9|nr:hypothetical protein [Haloferula sp. BvORR071]
MDADPVDEEPEACSWEMREGTLWVKSKATLPMVDLYSGESAERMILMRIQLLRAAVLWMRRLQLYYRDRSGDAFGVCGVHPEALKELEQLKGRR